MAAIDSNIVVTHHGVLAVDVYKFFSTNASTANQKQKVKTLLSEYTFACINQNYYLQSCEQLDQFLALLKPRTRNGDSTAQQRARFLLENSHLWEQLPATLPTGKPNIVSVHVKCVPRYIMCHHH